MHRSRIVILTGFAIAAISLAFPLVRLAGAGSVNGIDGDGWPAVVILGAVAGLAVLGDRAEGMSGPVALAAIGGGGLAVIYAVVKLADAADAIDIAGGGSLGFGIWLLIAGGAVAMGGALLSFSRRLS